MLFRSQTLDGACVFVPPQGYRRGLSAESVTGGGGKFMTTRRQALAMPATLESSRKLLRRERTSLFACLEIIWRVACCRDRPPATPRLPENRPNETDNLHKEAKERGPATLAQLSLHDLGSDATGWTNLFLFRCANHVRNRFPTPSVTPCFLHRREEENERKDLI